MNSEAFFGRAKEVVPAHVMRADQAGRAFGQSARKKHQHGGNTVVLWIVLE